MCVCGGGGGGGGREGGGGGGGGGLSGIFFHYSAEGWSLFFMI